MEASRNHWRDVRVVYCACLESMCAKSTPGSNPGLSARFYSSFNSNPKVSNDRLLAKGQKSPKIHETSRKPLTATLRRKYPLHS